MLRNGYNRFQQPQNNGGSLRRIRIISMNFRSCSALVAAALLALPAVFVRAQQTQQPRQTQTQQQTRQEQTQQPVWQTPEERAQAQQQQARQRQNRQQNRQGQNRQQNRQTQTQQQPIQSTSQDAGTEKLVLNDKGYFERTGVNVLVFSNAFTGGFNDEKNSGIEIIHHGVRTVQGGAVRLSKTPEQWDLVPQSPLRRVNPENNSFPLSLPQATTEPVKATAPIAIVKPREAAVK